MCERLIEWLAVEGCIEEDEKQVYGYAAASFGTACRPVAVFLVIAAAANRVAEGLMMLFAFVFLRRMSGGYHAKTLWRCFLVSLTVFCIGLAAADTITEMFVWDIAVLAASLELFLEGPLVSVRRPLDEGEELINQRQLKRRSAAMLAGYAALRLVGTPMSRYYAAGMDLVGCLHMVGIVNAKDCEGKTAEVGGNGKKVACADSKTCCSILQMPENSLQ